MADNPSKSIGLEGLENVAINTPLDGQILKYDSGSVTWVNDTDVAGVTTASNAGDGLGTVFKQKVLDNLEFNNNNILFIYPFYIENLAFII